MEKIVLGKLFPAEVADVIWKFANWRHPKPHPIAIMLQPVLNKFQNIMDFCEKEKYYLKWFEHVTHLPFYLWVSLLN